MKILFITLIVIVLIIFLITNYFLELAISSKKDKGDIIKKNENNKFPFPLSKDKDFIKKLKNRTKNYKIKSSFDNINLYYYVIENENVNTNKYIVLVHGFNSNHESLGHFGKIFYDLGYNLITLDLRGHGKSKANYLGMGILDAKDLLDVILDFNKRNKKK